MEFGKSMAVSSFDWDDSALIKEYDRIMKQTKNELSKDNKNEKGASNKDTSKEKEEKPWMVRDYCRALYAEDNRYYEASIVAIHDMDTCTVDFLGYNDQAEVAIDSLKESKGKAARKRQLAKATKVETSNCASDTECRNDYREALPAPDVSQNHVYSDHQTSQVEEIYQPPRLPNPPPTSNHAAANQIMPAQNPTCSHPPPPPMPQCSAVSKDPALSAMLVSWYMAGYYTGLHENQKSSSSRPRCCDHYYRHRPVQNCCDYFHY